jgi:hypothetical protein
MHALHVLPLLAAGPARFGRDRLDELAQTRVVQVVAAGYGATVSV